MAIHRYYPHAYVVNASGVVIHDIGTYPIYIAGFTGTNQTFSGNNKIADYQNYLSQHVEDDLEWGASGIVANSFPQNALMFYRQLYAKLNVFWLPNTSFASTDKIKLVFPVTEDYLLAVSGMGNSDAGHTFKAYDKYNHLLYNFNIDIPGSVNRLNDPTYMANSINGRLVSEDKFTETGFDVADGVSINDYYVSGSEGTSIYILKQNGNYLYTFLNRQTADVPPGPDPGDDPYSPGGYSDEDTTGGDQNFDSEVITPTPLPTFSFADSGFCRIYKPSLTELRALANYMWTDDDFLTTVVNHAKQLFEDPMDSVISFSLVPVVPPTSTPEQVKVLFIPVNGVTMHPVTNQFVEVDCGTLSLAREDNYGSALDFNPYTKIDLYLPFIGQVTLDTDEVMYKTIKCKYNVDVVTGMCVASISVMTDLGESVLYQYAGHCGVQMPLNSADFSGYVGAIIGAAKMVAGLAAAGAGAPSIGAGIIGGPTSQTSSTITHKEPDVTTIGGVTSKVTGRNPATGRQVTAGTTTRTPQEITRTYGDRTSTYSTSPPSFGELATRGAVNTVDAVMGGKLIIQHSGGFTGNSGFIAGATYPYVIIKRPRQCRPENYAKYHGYPSMIYMNLGSVSGYTEVNEIHLEGMSATNPELGEIAMLLKSGVIL